MNSTSRPKTKLILSDVLQDLECQWINLAAAQIDDPSRIDDGGVVDHRWGIADRGPDFAPHLIANALVLGVAGSKGLFLPDVTTDALRRSARRAAEFMLRNMRPTGRIDLIRRHPDDGTANAFALQIVGPALERARSLAAADPDWREVLAPIEDFARRATLGMLDGGFHTPNHRWIVCGALAVGGALFPEIEVGSVISAYLAETLDIDEEGFFIERSVGIYDGFIDRSLLFLDQYCPNLAESARARAAAVANLRANLWLINADATVETGLSHRQDRGSAVAGYVLLESYLYAALIENDPVFLGTAARLYSRPETRATAFMAHLLLGGIDSPLLQEITPETIRASRPRGRQVFPSNGLVRFQDESLDASFFRGQHRLCHFKVGCAELASIKIEQAYFGSGKFMAEHLEVGESELVFESHGNVWHSRRPGYDLPACRPVARDEFYNIADRKVRPFPRCHSRIAVRRDGDIFTFHYQTLTDVDRVLTQMALDFPAGGIWDTGDCSLQPLPGQYLYLKRGTGRMRYGNDVIEVGPGAHTHTGWPGVFDGNEGPGELVRVLFTFETPVDFELRLRAYRAASS